MLYPLRGRETEVMDAMRESFRTRGRMPTAKEICTDIGMHRGVLHRIIRGLETKGYLEVLPRGTLPLRLVQR